MKKQILKGYALVICSVLLLFGLLAAIIFSNSITKTVKAELHTIVLALKQSYNSDLSAVEQAEEMDKISKAVRVTIIKKDGTVLADSWADETQMENHFGREEISLADTLSYGVSVRSSKTLGQNMMYVATKCPDGNYLRIAKEYPSFLSNILSLLPALLISAVVCFALALVVSKRFAVGISKPIAQLSDSLKQVKDGTVLDPKSYPYDELQSMAGDINVLSGEISHALSSLQNEKVKINYILDNMAEGFILLDQTQNILIFNKSAKDFLDCNENCIGKNIIHATRNLQFLQIINNIKKDQKPTGFDFEKDNKVLKVMVSCVADEQKTGMPFGIVVLMADVTEVRNLAKMRSEFFSNASHELKTPITSIQGFAELLACTPDLSKEKELEFSAHILKESKRITSLINDVILISRLESGDISYEKELLDLEKLVIEACENVRPLANQNQITLGCNTEQCGLFGSSKQIQTLVDNLLTNAIRYNHNEGAVNVVLQKTETEIVLSVNNTGEIIEKKYFERVFERFYRIDKGRSTSVGGTGLGLSIVKHIAMQYGAQIDLQSSKDQGTTFSVKFPLA